MNNLIGELETNQLIKQVAIVCYSLVPGIILINLAAIKLYLISEIKKSGCNTYGIITKAKSKNLLIILNLQYFIHYKLNSELEKVRIEQVSKELFEKLKSVKTISLKYKSNETELSIISGNEKYTLAQGKKYLFSGFFLMILGCLILYITYPEEKHTGNIDNGYGTLEKYGYKYSGYWYGSMFQGQGTLTYPNGNTDSGRWETGSFIKGIRTEVKSSYGDPCRYIGEWSHNMRNGYGTLICPNSDAYTGEFKDNFLLEPKKK